MDIRLELLAAAHERDMVVESQRSALRRVAVGAAACCRRLFNLLPARRPANAACAAC